MTNRLAGLFHEDVQQGIEGCEHIITDIRQTMEEAEAEKNIGKAMMAVVLAEMTASALATLRFSTDDCEFLMPADIPVEVTERALYLGPKAIPGEMEHEGVTYYWCRREPNEFPQEFKERN